MAIDGQLHSVDLDSGEATQIGNEPGFLQGLADYGGTLYGIKTDDPGGGFPPWRLTTVDKATGATTPIVDLPALDGSNQVAMDFDAGGRLWILAAEPGSRLFRMDDPFSGQVELVHDLDTAFPVEGLALLPPPFPVEIPALGGAGLAVLAAFLLVAACRRLLAAGGGHRGWDGARQG
jgi:hypothetical protein